VKLTWDPFLQLAGHRLPDREAIERLRRHIAYVTDQLYGIPPRTFRHDDDQPNNLFFAMPQGGIPFTVIDWGMCLTDGAHTMRPSIYAVVRLQRSDERSR